MFSKKILDICISEKMIRIQRSFGVSSKRFGINSEEFEKNIEDFAYSGEGLQKDAVVENAKLPPTILAFYYFVYSKLKIPTEKDLLKTYYEINEVVFSGESVLIEGKKYPEKGIEARILRTYPSLLRDLHFYLLLNESELFENVRYSLKTDYCDGIDIIITYRDKEFGLAVYTGTKRAKSYKNKKAGRHNEPNAEIREIELKVDRKTSTRIGSFDLLNKTYIDLVVGRCEELIKS